MSCSSAQHPFESGGTGSFQDTQGQDIGKERREDRELSEKKIAQDRNELVISCMVTVQRADS